jgi:hypothetical protein
MRKASSQVPHSLLESVALAGIGPEPLNQRRL